MPESPHDLPDPDYLNQANCKENLSPLHSLLPDKHPLRLAREYLRDCDLHKALLRAGYIRLSNWYRTRDRAKRIECDDRFQGALLQATEEILVSTLRRVAVTEKGTAAVGAAEKLVASITTVKPKPKSKDAKKKDW